MAVTVKEEAGVEVRSGSEGPQAEVGPASIATGEGEELRRRLRDEGGFVVPRGLAVEGAGDLLVHPAPSFILRQRIITDYLRDGGDGAEHLGVVLVFDS